MYICKICGNPLKIHLNNVISIESVPQITEDGLLISRISLEKKPGATVRQRAVFYCQICDKEVGYSNVLIECSACFKHFEANELSIFNDVGGQYCKKDSEKYVKHGLKPISVKDLIFTVSIKKERG